MLKPSSYAPWAARSLIQFRWSSPGLAQSACKLFNGETILHNGLEEHSVLVGPCVSVQNRSTRLKAVPCRTNLEWTL
ncbi:hypothetical protein K461DRAFT_1095 [Myriangium duriaei CBS 260.36]|uniref:Uncharacterized protein n=1 Tax=Myriangium duriaei CBS 260.36 TaxID=1168546 RepID=A0A9P4J821_9PEZI|nr:hypothetical protein K461DRAFT_1095 [Myriangium duriaei CBS 260.36]